MFAPVKFVIIPEKMMQSVDQTFRESYAADPTAARAENYSNFSPEQDTSTVLQLLHSTRKRNEEAEHRSAKICAKLRNGIHCFAHQRKVFTRFLNYLCSKNYR